MEAGDRLNKEKGRRPRDLLISVYVHSKRGIQRFRRRGNVWRRCSSRERGKCTDPTLSFSGLLVCVFLASLPDSAESFYSSIVELLLLLLPFAARLFFTRRCTTSLTVASLSLFYKASDETENTQHLRDPRDRQTDTQR